MVCAETSGVQESDAEMTISMAQHRITSSKQQFMAITPVAGFPFLYACAHFNCSGGSAKLPPWPCTNALTSFVSMSVFYKWRCRFCAAFALAVPGTNE